MSDHDRRRVLKYAGLAVATGGLTATAETTAGDATTRDRVAEATTVDATGGWSSFRGNAGNTGSAPTSSGPSSPLTVAWEHEHGGRFAVVDETVYVVTNEGGVRALDANDGTLQWTSETDAGTDANAAGSPAVADDTVYVTGDRASPAVTALEAGTGEVRWRATDLGYETNLAPTVAGGKVLIVVDKVLYALDANTGEPQWQFEPEPVTFDGREYGDRLSRRAVAVADGTVFAVANKQLFARDVETGEKRWTAALGDDWLSEVFAGTPMATDGAVAIIKAGRATVFDAETGEERSSFSDRSLDALTKTRVYAVTETDDGEAGVTGYDRESGDSVWETSERAVAFGSPVVDDAAVYAPAEISNGDTGVIAFDDVDGSRKWSVATDARPNRLAVVGETLYADVDGTLLAIRSKDATTEDANEDDPESSPGFTAGATVAGGALSLELLRRRAAGRSSEER